MLRTDFSKFSRLIVFLSVFLALQACESSYSETGLSGRVTSSMLDSSTAQVSVKVNAFTSPETAYQFALLKSAETTVQAGFGHFQIIDQSNYSRTTSTTTYNPYLGYSGTFTTNTMNKPRVNLIVRMFPGPKPRTAPVGVFDARDVVSTIGPQVKR